MGIIIDNHFYTDLFVEKKVNYYNELYLMLFDCIWPSQENFKNFLQASDNTLKIQYAKKIYEDIAFDNDLFLPSFTILNVLEDQYRQFYTDNNKFFSQDHVVHCINLYVLGVYLFFNYNTFSSKLVNIDNKDDYSSKIKSFIKKWQSFALYHDVGYYFEDKNIYKKSIKSYERIYYDIIHCCIIKNISRTYVFKGLIEKSTVRFNSDFINEDLYTWYNNSNVKLSKEKLKKELKQFDDAIAIDGIKSDENLVKLFPLLNESDYLVAIYNKYGYCVSLIIRNKLKIKKCFTNDVSLINRFITGNLVINADDNFFARYYLPNVDNDFFKSAIDELVVITNVQNQFPTYIKQYFSIFNKNINELLFAVNKWVTDVLPLDPYEEKTLYDQKILEYYKYEISKNIFDLIEKSDLKFSVDNKIYSKTKKDIKSLINTNIESILNNSLGNATKSYNDEYGVTHNFIALYREQIDNIYNDEFVKKNIEKLKLFHENSTKFDLSLFSYDKENVRHQRMFQYVSDLCSEINISISQLQSYKPDYAPFDHGVISAGLLFQTALFNIDLHHICKKKNMLLLAWEEELCEKYIKQSAESIFSILLHNIYTKTGKPEFGINYNQDINKNTFSYFCAFCDTIQKRGRQKKLDLSKTNLANVNYLEDEFDICIKKDKICIKCVEKNIDNIKKEIVTAESFLPGISEIIYIEKY